MLIKETAYIAGPFTASHGRTQDENIAAAKAFAVREVRSRELVPVVPHVAVLEGLTYEEAMAECFALIASCDVLVLMPNWAESPGAVRENAFAESIGKPVFTLEDLEGPVIWVPEAGALCVSEVGNA